jgi:hypothetical protein
MITFINITVKCNNLLNLIRPVSLVLSRRYSKRSCADHWGATVCMICDPRGSNKRYGAINRCILQRSVVYRMYGVYTADKFLLILSRYICACKATGLRKEYYVLWAFSSNGAKRTKIHFPFLYFFHPIRQCSYVSSGSWQSKLVMFCLCIVTQ